MARKYSRQVHPCKVDNCAGTARKRGWCSPHYNRWWRTGNPLVNGPRRIGGPPPGELHPNWVGDNAGYITMHARVRRQLGQPAANLCAGCCGSRAQTWAYDHTDPQERFDAREGHPYSLDVKRYVPLCRSCHSSYDAAYAKAS